MILPLEQELEQEQLLLLARHRNHRLLVQML
jgi:hypothetical protein